MKVYDLGPFYFFLTLFFPPTLQICTKIKKTNGLRKSKEKYKTILTNKTLKCTNGTLLLAVSVADFTSSLFKVTF